MIAIARNSRPLKLSSGAVMMLAGLGLSVIVPPVAASDRERSALTAPHSSLLHGRQAIAAKEEGPPKLLNCDFNGDFLRAPQECPDSDGGRGILAKPPLPPMVR